LKSIWYKRFDCPVCRAQFRAPRVFSEALRVSRRDRDLMPHYEGVNLLFYDLVTCDHCLFTAFEKEYVKTNTVTKSGRFEKLKRLTKRAKEIYGGINLGEGRNVDDAIAIHILGASTYHILGRDRELAEVYLRLGWLYRLKGERRRELHALGRALIHFERVYQTTGDLDAVQRALFYIAEINRRLGRKDEAVRYYSELFQRFKNSGSVYLKVARQNREEIR